VNGGRRALSSAALSAALALGPVGPVTVQPGAPASTSTTSALEGETSVAKDLVGGGVLAAIVAATIAGFIRSARRFR
jgi:hypothetical protein